MLPRRITRRVAAMLLAAATTLTPTLAFAEPDESILDAADYAGISEQVEPEIDLGEAFEFVEVSEGNGETESAAVVEVADSEEYPLETSSFDEDIAFATSAEIVDWA